MRIMNQKYRLSKLAQSDLAGICRGSKVADSQLVSDYLVGKNDYQ